MSRIELRGSALVVVILALALLLSLGVPFLLAGRMRSESAQQSFDQVRARIEIDSASRYAQARQAESHPSLDRTPWWDAPGEWSPLSDGVMPQALGGAWERSASSWGFEAESLQGRVSLASAPPVLIQNLLHPCFLTDDADFRAAELSVSSTDGFPQSGLLFLANQWVEYGDKNARAFLQVTPAAEENTPDDLSRTRFREGTAVIDPRVVNLAYARLRWGEQRAPDFAADVLGLDVLGHGVLPPAERRRLRELSWLETGVYGSGDWGPATWLTREINPDNPTRAVVADALGFSQGSVVRVSPEEGDPVDLLVLAAGSGRGGSGALVAATDFPDFPPFTTRLYPLLREPVDLNHCAPEILEALVVGLRWNGFVPWPSGEDGVVRRLSGNTRTDWITPAKARAFAAQVVAARPLQGPQDLWNRVLVPLELAGTLNSRDALLIHLNGFQAASGQILQSTLPFGYRTGDRYLQRVNAAVRSRLGSTLARRSERQLVRAAPGGDSLRLWRTQRDFDEEERWGRGRHGVMSLPNNIGGFGGHHGPDLALGLRTGAYLPSGILAPEERGDEQAYLMPEPARETDQFGISTVGRTLHFDWERSPLGWDVRETGPHESYLFEWAVTGPNGVYSANEPLHFQGWFEMPSGSGDASLLDVAGPTTDGNRVSAAFEEGKLVVRGFDTAGDDPLDPDGLEQAVTITVDPAEYPMENRWMHLGVLLRGIHPRGLQLALDGVPRGEVNCMTHTLAAVDGFAPGDTDGVIAVESTEGFPSRGALRIGEEVLEYSSKDETTFFLSRTSGPDQYLGGRVAREASDVLIASQDSVHPAGSAVELYGYSAILAAPLSPGGGRLSGELGPWSLAHPVNGEAPINVLSLQGTAVEVGMGFTSDWIGDMELAAAVEGDPYFAEAFQTDGGFALMFQARPGWIDGDGARLGGWEVVRYSQRTEEIITILERNVVTPNWEDAPDGMVSSAGNSFITDWRQNIYDNSGAALWESPRWQVYLMPISVKGSGVSDLAYPDPDPEFSEFVQLTTPGDSGLTEWVRYDDIIENIFVRDDPGAILRVTVDRVFLDELDPPDGKGSVGYRPPLQDPPEPDLFVRKLGEPVDDRDGTLTDMLEAFDFRGSMQTYDHAQPANTLLVPIGRTLRRFGPSGGYVGRLDRVAVMDPQSGSSSPFWFTVEWGLAPPPEQPDRLHLNQTYFAFTDSPGVPYAATDLSNVNLDDPGIDVRNTVRLVKFPSGERPLQLEQIVLGGDVSGGAGNFEGVIDEFAVHTVPGMGQPFNHTGRGAFVLEQDLEPGELDSFYLHEYALQIGTERKSSQNPGDWFSLLPPSGLLDIDGERIAYTEIDPATGEVMIAPQGRGVHGTQPRGHAAGTTVWAVDGRAATVLTSDLEQTAPLIQVENALGFATRPLLLIDQELIHAPLRGLAGNQFLMPLRRPDPEREEDGGEGLLRGRFGTAPSGHPTGTLVYSMPTRWEDRYIPESDSPAGAWFEIGLEEPGAYWRGLRFEAEIPDGSQRVRALARAGTAGWEDPPGQTPGLILLEEGVRNGLPVPLGLRADRLDLRFSFDWEPGAFEAVDFRSFGWLSAPRISEILLDFSAESRVDRSVEVRQ